MSHCSALPSSSYTKPIWSQWCLSLLALIYKSPTWYQAIFICILSSWSSIISKWRCVHSMFVSLLSPKNNLRQEMLVSLSCARDCNNVECGKAVKKVHTCIRVCSVKRLSVTIYPFTRKLHFIYLSNTLRNLSKTATDLAVMILLFFCFKGWSSQTMSGLAIE